jgi:hypothetical protein
MGAAGAQQLHHLRPILVAVELGLHRVRRRCLRSELSVKRRPPSFGLASLDTDFISADPCVFFERSSLSHFLESAL